MSNTYFSRDGSISASVVGGDGNKTLFEMRYNGGWPSYEYHEIKLYDWARRLHGNAPGGTPYGYIRATRTGKRVIIRV